MPAGVITASNALIKIGNVVDDAFATADAGLLTISDCAAWSISETGEIKAYRSCNTAGFKRKLLGGRDFKGTLKYFFNEGDPVTDTVRAGTKLLFKLYLDQTANPSNSSGTHEDTFYICPAIVSDVKVDANIDGGDVIPCEISFEGNGTLYYPGDTVPASIPA